MEGILVDISEDELKTLKSQLSRLKLETRLRKDLGSELDRQKIIAENAEKLAKQRGDEIAEISRKLAKYLPEQLYNSIFSGETDAGVKSERKFLTVFFSDIVSFTQISENMEADLLTEMLNLYLTEMTELVLDNEGTLDKYIGDSIMVFFGDPRTSGKYLDALKCLEMAISMQKRMAVLGVDFVKKYDISEPLKIRIGINSGFSTVGNFGNEKRLDYTVIGRSVNLASRLETAAKPSSILISESTYELVKGDINLDDAGEFELKGIHDKVKTYEVIPK
jgi:class 3 adenylate cyclase